MWTIYNKWSINISQGESSQEKKWLGNLFCTAVVSGSTFTQALQSTKTWMSALPLAKEGKVAYCDTDAASLLTGPKKKNTDICNNIYHIYMSRWHDTKSAFCKLIC